LDSLTVYAIRTNSGVVHVAARDQERAETLFLEDSPEGSILLEIREVGMAFEGVEEGVTISFQR
jgi:hypothetical protein